MLSMKERIQYMKNEFQGATANDIDEKALNRRAQYIGAKSDQLTELSRFVKKNPSFLKPIFLPGRNLGQEI